MAADFQFSQSNGAGQTKTDIGSGVGGNYWNFKNADTAVPSDYATYPITAGNRSYDVWIQGHFTGTFNSISNIKFWCSTLLLTGYGTGALISGDKEIPGAYVTPATTDTGEPNVPTAEGSALALAYGTNFSDYVQLQLETGADATPGDGGTSTFTLKYDES
jgi:hypothetical protein